VLNLIFNQKFHKFSAMLLLASAFALLTACGDGGSGAGGTTTTTGGGGAIPVPVPVAAPSLTIALTDPTTGATVTSISNGTSATVNATLRDAAGAAVANTVVTFSAASTLATMIPTSGTALTNASGVATITLTGGGVAGATTISANAQVGTAAVTGSIGFAVGAANVTITTPVFGVGTASLSAFGTTSVTVTVNSGGVPVTSAQTVTFSSPCASANPVKAVLSTSATTVNGVAIASYRDNGCAGTDIITASVSGLASSSATLSVIAPETGSIQYISSSPINISLKGTGGTEVSQVTFKVTDASGGALSGKVVNFGLSTTVGGIILTPNTGTPFTSGTATSDANGLVFTQVNAGNVSTPVRVTATTCSNSTNPCTGTILTTQSSGLTITTGIPDQFGFSLAATTHSIEGWNVDGITSVFTVRLADHFKNPAPDGTGVVFTSEASTVVGSCSTVAGACSAVFTSSGTRPSNGRVTVLAYAVGEETFTDLNGNGWADSAKVGPPVIFNELIDPNGNATDLPEAYVDYNENGQWNSATEPYVDFNQDGAYNIADGKFNGVLCDDVTAGRSSAGTCSTTHTLHVRQSQTMVLASSSADITINGLETATATTTSGSNTLSNVNLLIGTLGVGHVLSGPGISAGTTITSIALPSVVMSAAATASGASVNITATAPAPTPAIGLPPCSTAAGTGAPGEPFQFIATIVDVNGNSMPAGTTVAFTTNNGTITSGTSFTMADSTGCRSSTHLVAGVPVLDYPGCPVSAGSATFGDIVVTMKSDAVFAAGTPNTCTNSNGTSGTFTVKVTSPKGLITYATKTVTD
jgi:hypothetical protein